MDYALRVTGDTVSGEVRLTIDVLKQGWVSIQVPPGLLVRDARLDGQRTALVDGNPPRVMIARTGRATTLPAGTVEELANGNGPGTHSQGVRR